MGAVLMMAPLVMVFASGGDDTTMDPIGAELDGKQVPAQYRQWVEKAGRECALITGPVIAAQIEAESSWDPNAESRDKQGNVIAQGISQFIPTTWATHGVDVASKNGAATPDGVADVFTPGDAIVSQGKYDCDIAQDVARDLKSGRIEGDPLSLTLAAYNAGMGAVQSAGGIPNIPETQVYVTRILVLIPQFTAANGGTSEISGPFGQRVVAQARRQLGTPYSWGGGTVEGPGFGFAQGAGTKGFDCSSLVQYAVYHASNGKILLPRTSQVQVTQGKAVAPGQMRVGDIIGFSLNGSGYDHIGIYTGNGRMIHAPKTGDVVKESDITDSYYKSKPQVIRRLG